MFYVFIFILHKKGKSKDCFDADILFGSNVKKEKEWKKGFAFKIPDFTQNSHICCKNCTLIQQNALMDFMGTDVGNIVDVVLI